MEFKNVLMVVTDLPRSVEFYQKYLGLNVELNLGANVTLTGGISLQTRDSWLEFVQKPAELLRFGGNDAELYFETEDFDGFLDTLEGVRLVAPVIEHRWGQRVVRLYDPDDHIIEVGEPLQVVCRRFLESGLTQEGIARRMDVPLELVEKWLPDRER